MVQVVSNRNCGRPSAAEYAYGGDIACSKTMLRALAQRVDRIELTGTPVWAVNNIIRRLERLPIKLVRG
jgi:hypothetical protein